MNLALPRVIQVTREDLTLTFSVRSYGGMPYWVARSPGYEEFPLPLHATGKESAAFFELAARDVLREMGF